MNDLRIGVQGIGGHKNCANFEQGKIGDHELGRIGDEETHAISLFYTKRIESGRQAIGERIHFPVGNDGSVKDRTGGFRMFSSSLLEECENRGWWKLQTGGDI